MNGFNWSRSMILLSCIVTILLPFSFFPSLSFAKGTAKATQAQSTDPDYTANNLPSWAIGPFTRSGNNPILTPEGSGWEGANVYNPGVIIENNTFKMIYRGQASSGTSEIGYATSTDGKTFTRSANNPVISASTGLEDPRLIKLNNTYYAYYTGYQNGQVAIEVATSTDLINWTQYGPIITGTKNAAVITDSSSHPVQIDGKYVMYYGGNSGRYGCGQGGCGSYLTYSTDLIHWSGATPVDFHFPTSFTPWEICVGLTNYPTIQGGALNQNIVLFVAGTLMAQGRWWYAISETEFSKTNLTQQLDQLTEPVLSPSAPYELSGHINNTIFMNTITFYNGQWWMYYGASDHVIALANAPLRSATNGYSAFTSTNFEPGERLPDWTDGVDLNGQPGGGINGVGGISFGSAGPGAPELGMRQEVAHTGSTALMYSGSAQGASTDYAYMQAFDLSSTPYQIGANTTLTYWIYPQSTNSFSGVSGNNSTCVSLDLILSNGTASRNSGVVDQHGNRLHPAYQCNKLQLDTWNQVTANLGSLSGKAIVRIDVGYDQPGSTGGYRGYIDDIALSS